MVLLSKKKLASAAIVCSSFAQCFADSVPAVPSAFPQFYAGVGLGGEKLSGTRSEQFRDTLPPFRTFVFTNRAGMGGEKGTVFGMAGFLWAVPNTPILIGPEIYLGRGASENLKNEQAFDPLAGAFRYYQNRVQRKSYFGGNVRFGLSVRENWFAYFSAGVESSYFQNSVVFVQDPIATAPNVINFGKWMSGPRFSLGFERKIGSFKLGLDLAMTKFGSFSSTKSTNFATDFLDITIKPKIYTLSLRLSYLF